MVEQNQIQKGDKVSVIIEVWREDELPTVSNFYQGKITEIVERTKNCFYVKIENLDRLIPIDRVIRKLA
jgi:ribosomal protein L21E